MSNRYLHTLTLAGLLTFPLLLAGCANTDNKTSTPDAPVTATQAKAKPRIIPQSLPEHQQQAGTIVQLPATQTKQIETAVKQAIPESTQQNTVVDAIQKPGLKYPTIIISHLLEGRSASDADSTVRGDYGTHAKLTVLSQQRSYQILQSALNGIDASKTSELIANINHGVEHRLMGEGKDKDKILYAKETATNIYSTSINLEQVAPDKWQKMGQNAFTQNWTVEYNRIPSLQFGTTKPTH